MVGNVYNHVKSSSFDLVGMECKVFQYHSNHMTTSQMRNLLSWSLASKTVSASLTVVSCFKRYVSQFSHKEMLYDLSFCTITGHSIWYHLVTVTCGYSGCCAYTVTLQNVNVDDRVNGKTGSHCCAHWHHANCSCCNFKLKALMD